MFSVPRCACASPTPITCGSRARTQRNASSAVAKRKHAGPPPPSTVVQLDAPGGVAAVGAGAAASAVAVAVATASPPFPEACGSRLGGGVREQPAATSAARGLHADGSGAVVGHQEITAVIQPSTSSAAGSVSFQPPASAKILRRPADSICREVGSGRSATSIVARTRQGTSPGSCSTTTCLGTLTLALGQGEIDTDGGECRKNPLTALMPAPVRARSPGRPHRWDRRRDGF